MELLTRIFFFSSYAVLITGSIFKILHWLGGNFMTIAGIIMLIISLVLRFVYQQRSQEERSPVDANILDAPPTEAEPASRKLRQWPIYIRNGGFVILLISYLFRLMHWPFVVEINWIAIALVVGGVVLNMIFPQRYPKIEEGEPTWKKD